MSFDLYGFSLWFKVTPTRSPGGRLKRNNDKKYKDGWKKISLKNVDIRFNYTV